MSGGGGGGCLRALLGIFRLRRKICCFFFTIPKLDPNLINFETFFSPKKSYIKSMWGAGSLLSIGYKKSIKRLQIWLKLTARQCMIKYGSGTTQPPNTTYRVDPSRGPSSPTYDIFSPPLHMMFILPFLEEWGANITIFMI